MIIAGGAAALLVVVVLTAVVARALGPHRYLGPLKPLDGAVSAVAFSPDGKLVATALAVGTDAGQIKLWDAETGRPQSRKSSDSQGRIDVPAQVMSLAFSSDSDTLAAGLANGSAHVWSLEAGGSQVIGTPSSPPTPTYPADPYPTDPLPYPSIPLPTPSLPLPFPSGLIPTDLEPGFKRSSHGPSKAPAPLPTRAPEGSAFVAFVGDGERLAVAAGEKVEVYEVAGGTPRQSLDSSGTQVRSVAVSDNAKLLAAGRADGSVQVWDLASGRATLTLKGHLDDVGAVAFHPTKELLASGSADGTTRLWQLPAGTETAMLTGHDQEVRSLAFSPNGKTLVTGGSKSPVRLWDVGRRTAAARFDGHAQGVTSVAYSPDGRTVIAGGTTADAWLSDVSSLPS
ncbi:WD40 repeat protein [Actinomadura pelletieri DSM 43383]|uniref:WD40 repeat protein n=1 Tax=Actinomadura pelletieri DSM 43383 TaxID=1120940 RepID=A0A495QYU8_9ACTN|nr:WD40 repeat domain-containing protein [Actinomadura pelletieri]RKS79371.1 WD40 repeat protein [Actinomadura pelletieri DSM 43383]